MRLKSEDGKMGLPEYIKIGLELEAENVNRRGIKRALNRAGLRRLPVGSVPMPRSIKRAFKIDGSKKWVVKKDGSLVDNGREVVSPPLSEAEKPDMWQEIERVCSIISQNPHDSEREAYTDHTCGGHIHFDASIFQSNPEITKNFLRLWAEGEELIYKMCNDKNDPIRDSALGFSPVESLKKILFSAPAAIVEIVRSKRIENTPKACYKAVKGTWHGLLNLLQSAMYRDGYSFANGARIMKAIEEDKLKVKTVYRHKKPKLKLHKSLQKMGMHYSGLNLQNADNRRHFWEKLGKNKKLNTVEFRLSNGTIDPRVLRENVFLYASLIQTAVRMTDEPELVQDKLKAFYETDISEEEKVKRFLELIIDEPEDREVYQERWKSVKDAPVFQGKYAKGFAKGRFVRDDLRGIAENTRIDQLKEALRVIANRAKDLWRDESSGLILEGR